jgi:hypothetical protein
MFSSQLNATQTSKDIQCYIDVPFLEHLQHYQKINNLQVISLDQAFEEGEVNALVDVLCMSRMIFSACTALQTKICPPNHFTKLISSQ